MGPSGYEHVGLVEVPPIHVARGRVQADPVRSKGTSGIWQPEEVDDPGGVELEDEDGDQELDPDGDGHQDFQAKNPTHLGLLTLVRLEKKLYYWSSWKFATVYRAK